MEKNFKVDDWVYHEFELVQIKEIEDDKVTKVTDGVFSTWSMDLNKYCFPIDMEIKQISDMVKEHYQEINNINFRCLNLPDIHRKFVEYWVEMCESVNEEQDFYIDIKSKYLSFFENIKGELNKLKEFEIERIKIFK